MLLIKGKKKHIKTGGTFFITTYFDSLWHAECNFSKSLYFIFSNIFETDPSGKKKMSNEWARGARKS